MDINEYGLFVVFDDPYQPGQVIDLPLNQAPRYTLKQTQGVGYYLHGEMILHIGPGYSPAEEGYLQNKVPPKELFRVTRYFDSLDQAPQILDYIPEAALNFTVQEAFQRYFQESKPQFQEILLPLGSQRWK